MTVLRANFKGKTLPEFAEQYLTDIGPSGIFLRTKSPLPVGSRFRFDFRLEGATPLLAGEGVVVWVADENPDLGLPSGMEVRFERLHPECQSNFDWLQLIKRGVSISLTPPLPGSGQPSVVAQREATAREYLAGGSDLGRAPVEAPAPPKVSPPVQVPAPAEPPSPVQAPALPARSRERESRPPEALRPAIQHPRSRRRMTYAWLFTGALAAVVIAGTAYVFFSQEPVPRPTGSETVDRVARIVTHPEGAEVLANGRSVGRAPLDIPIEKRLVITVQHPGFTTETAEIGPFDARFRQRGNRLIMMLEIQLRASSGAEERAAPREDTSPPITTP